jgi:peptidoglycan/xylan/chitin deacetylase (PgdA/CDA1 family)
MIADLNLKVVIYGVAKYTGLFALSRILTRKHLRILGYHGMAIKDEYLFRPMLFMSVRTFEKRMNFLSRKRYPVIGLNEAVVRLADGSLPPNATVITIDDGWSGTRLHIAPILSRYNFPATLYLSTYYLEKQTQVINVALSYVLWKTNLRQLNMGNICSTLQGTFELYDCVQRNAAVDYLVAHANLLSGAEDRQRLFQDICCVLDIDYVKIVEDRLFTYINKIEATELLAFGIDIQLHTHRHLFPNDKIEHARKEIQENRDVLGELGFFDLTHFCYPSGNYTKSQIPWLDEFGMKSATTTFRGLNNKTTHLLELCRFLDSDEISMIEFEAEMCGFKDIVKSIILRLRSSV